MEKLLVSHIIHIATVRTITIRTTRYGNLKLRFASSTRSAAPSASLPGSSCTSPECCIHRLHLARRARLPIWCCLLSAEVLQLFGQSLLSTANSFCLSTTNTVNTSNQRVRREDHSTCGDCWMLLQRRLDFERSVVVSRAVDHVVRATDEPESTACIACRPVA